jgi:hypothetical protein
LGSGHLSYYALDSNGRAEKKLLKSFARTHFVLMLSWVSAARVVNPEGLNVMDSSEMQAEEKVTQANTQAGTQVVTEAGQEADTKESVVTKPNITQQDDGSTIHAQAKQTRVSKTRGDNTTNDKFLDTLKEDSDKRV